MEALKVRIKSSSKKKYKIKGKEIDFELLEAKVRTVLFQEQFDRTAQAAKSSGLSKMTKKEIDTIINEVRKGA